MSAEIQQPRGEEIRSYWGDLVFVRLCIACVFLIVVMNTYDFLKGLLGF
jgi:hypothetical protein